MNEATFLEEPLDLLDRSGQTRDVAVTPDGQYAISASFDKKLKIWDIVQGA